MEYSERSCRAKISTRNRKIIMTLACMAVAAVCLCACGNEGNTENLASDRLKVVTTIFPEYDWVKEILGDKTGEADITFLTDNGVDMHSFQPSAEDILKIGEADVFIYVGGESDEWVEDALKEASNPDRRVVNLLDVLGDTVKEEELVEGMEAEHEDEEGEDDGYHDGEPEYDEHVWLSLKNAQVLCDAIAEALGEADPDDADVYTANAEAYKSKLDTLDKSYQEAVDAADIHTVLFGDRFPFRYMVDDYGLDYYAAFVGCSAETEASFETVIFLADKLDELGISVVLTLEKSDGRIASTVIENTASKDQKILSMDSLQSTTSEDVEKGATYLGAMEDNLKVLKEALGAVPSASMKRTAGCTSHSLMQSSNKKKFKTGVKYLKKSPI